MHPLSMALTIFLRFFARYKTCFVNAFAFSSVMPFFFFFFEPGVSSGVSSESGPILICSVGGASPFSAAALASYCFFLISSTCSQKRMYNKTTSTINVAPIPMAKRGKRSPNKGDAGFSSVGLVKVAISCPVAPRATQNCMRRECEVRGVLGICAGLVSSMTPRTSYIGDRETHDHDLWRVGLVLENIRFHALEEQSLQAQLVHASEKSDPHDDHNPNHRVLKAIATPRDVVHVTLHPLAMVRIVILHDERWDEG
mmetsp:Transcript_104234/g.300477  ORF Transcript_104234/g.300477 Transcript_104234/m.300477 type:complete len:255 (-) Transcript_104234:235-999(-)